MNKQRHVELDGFCLVRITKQARFVHKWKSFDMQIFFVNIVASFPKMLGAKHPIRFLPRLHIYNIIRKLTTPKTKYN